MRIRSAAAIAAAVVVAAVAAIVVLPGGSSGPPRARTAGADTDRPAPARSRPRFGGALEDCSTRSEANFPGAFTSPDNLVVGPLVLVGGAYTDPATVREFGGNKFPLLVEAGHTVTVRLGEDAPRTVGLAYGPLPEGETSLRDTYRSVTFVACRPGRASRRYSPDGPSGSYADDVAITFWSGFVLTRVPACVPLDVYVDDEPTPRRAALSLGIRCAS